MSSHNVTYNSTVCLFNSHGDSDFAAAVFYLAFALWGSVLGVYIFRMRSQLVESLALMLITLACLVGSLFLRSIWFFIHCFTPQSTDLQNGWLASLLGVVSLLLFFTSFSIYVFSWARSMNRGREVTLRNITIGGNAIIYVVVISLSIYFAFEVGGDFMVVEGVASDTIHIIVACCDLVLSILFAGYGTCALKLMQQIRAKTRTRASDQMGWRM